MLCYPFTAYSLKKQPPVLVIGRQLCVAGHVARLNDITQFIQSRLHPCEDTTVLSRPHREFAGVQINVILESLRMTGSSSRMPACDRPHDLPWISDRAAVGRAAISPDGPVVGCQTLGPVAYRPRKVDARRQICYQAI